MRCTWPASSGGKKLNQISDTNEWKKNIILFMLNNSILKTFCLEISNLLIYLSGCSYKKASIVKNTRKRVLPLLKDANIWFVRGQPKLLRGICF